MRARPDPTRSSVAPVGGIVLLAATLLATPAPAQDAPPRAPTARSRLAELELEDLLEVEVVSASRRPELASSAPATVIVVSREEILDRGYADLSEVLEDLPGMQVVRPYGPTYFKNYWRGFRNTIGDPFLLLVDGMVLNHLYFNTADVLVTVPLASVDRVEVMYGPASVAYGGNAFMGVIHVITRRPTADGTRASVTAAGGDETRLLDLAASWRHGDASLRVAARLDDGDLDAVDNDRYEYTRTGYLADPRLWGGFLANPELAGRFRSPHRHRAADLRLELGDLELGLAAYRLESGMGMEYPADRSQSDGVWARPEASAHLRLTRDLGPRVRSQTLLRYRSSDVDNDSYWLEGWNGEDASGVTRRLVAMTYWQALCSSWSLSEDVEVELSERLQLSAGLEVEEKDLQKAYDVSAGPALPPDEVDADAYPYPEPPPPERRAQNRITTEDLGAYALGRVALGEGQGLHLGLRVDSSSEWGSTTTVRAGYVAEGQRWVAKALYGEGFQEPVPRLLYGGWTGSGSDPSLEPERTRTAELSAGYRLDTVNQLLSLYRIDTRDTIVNTTDGARNLGRRSVVGVDYHLQGRLHPPGMRSLRVWAYLSHILDQEEREIDASGTEVGTRSIGDLAEDQVLAGATARLGEEVTVNLRGRYVAARHTVSTNPAGRVPSYVTVDLNLRWDDLLVDGVGASLRVGNLLDEQVVHPGVREADAGFEPGTFDAAGAWHGSAGWYSSLLPQAGRTLLLSLHLDL